MITAWNDTTLAFAADTMPVVVATDGDALVGLRFGRAADHAGWLGSAPREPAHPLLSAARVQLQAYAEGDKQVFDLPLSLAGTEFQRQVWAALRAIPYGQTSTYGKVAASIGRPTSTRAVGAAIGANPIGIVVPCHRVIGADGRLTGFAGGLDNKRTLLHREGLTAL